MKKMVLSLIYSVFVIANPLEFKTLNSEFTQIVKSQDSKIEYSGNFIATNKNAFWHYEKPNLKDIFKEYIKIQNNIYKNTNDLHTTKKLKENILK